MPVVTVPISAELTVIERQDFGVEMRQTYSDRADNLFDENIPLEHNMFSRVVEQAQERVEGSNFDVRKHTLEYDDVLNT